MLAKARGQREKDLVKVWVALLDKAETRAAQVEKTLSEVEAKVIEAKVKVANAEARTLVAEEVLGEAKNQVLVMKEA